MNLKYFNYYTGFTVSNGLEYGTGGGDTIDGDGVVLANGFCGGRTIDGFVVLTNGFGAVTLTAYSGTKFANII